MMFHTEIIYYSSTKHFSRRARLTLRADLQAKQPTLGNSRRKTSSGEEKRPRGGNREACAQ